MPFADIFLSDGHTIPSIAFGTGSIRGSKAIHKYIETALDEGFTYINTAQRAYNFYKTVSSSFFSHQSV